MIIQTAERLKGIADTFDCMERRDAFRSLRKFIASPPHSRIACLYGLRRTGKTTLGMQALIEADDWENSAYVLCQRGDSMHDIYSMMENWHGLKHVFLDEVTAIQDFADDANALSDIYANLGMRIIVSGTDSLAFRIASEHALFDRMLMIHTTYIPFREHHRLTGGSLLDYMREGGILGGGNEFRDSVERDIYAKVAIAENIQNSLAKWRDGEAFGVLWDLYERREFVTCIHRLLDSMNHRFLAKTLQGKWMPSVLKTYRGSMESISRNCKDERSSSNAFSTESLDMEKLRADLEHEIGVRDNLSIPPTGRMMDQLAAYLKALDVIEIHEDNGEKRIFFTQPGMRYSHLDALLSCLHRSGTLSRSLRDEQARIIRMAFEGHILEDIIFYHVLKDPAIQEEYECHRFRDPETFQEADLVLVHSVSKEIFLFEIKRIEKRKDADIRNLADPMLQSKVESMYGGAVCGMAVLYMGKKLLLDASIPYIPAEDFLLDTGDSLSIVRRSHGVAWRRAEWQEPDDDSAGQGCGRCMKRV